MLTKILKQIKKYSVLTAITFIIIAIFFFIKSEREKAAYKVEKKQFQAELKQKESDIHNLNESQFAHMNAAVIAKAEANNQAEKNKKLLTQLDKTNQENAKWKESVAAMTADAVVIETQKKLSLGGFDIYKNSFGVQFTLVGAKKNLLRLADADYFSLVREPKLLEIIDGKDKEISGLRSTILKDEKALVVCEDIKSKYKDIQINYADILKKSEKQTKWLKFTISGTVVAVAGTALYLLFGRGK